MLRLCDCSIGINEPLDKSWGMYLEFMVFLRLLNPSLPFRADRLSSGDMMWAASGIVLMRVPIS